MRDFKIKNTGIGSILEGLSESKMKAVTECKDMVGDAPPSIDKISGQLELYLKDMEFTAEKVTLGDATSTVYKVKTPMAWDVLIEAKHNGNLVLSTPMGNYAFPEVSELGDFLLSKIFARAVDNQ